jgi:hypothetical protein
MCDVPSIAVFCSEYIECFPGTAYYYYYNYIPETNHVSMVCIVATVLYVQFVLHVIPHLAERIMADLGRYSWIRETGTGQQLASHYDR